MPLDESIRVKFYDMYLRAKFSQFYFVHYRSRSVVIDRCIQVFLISASLAGVAGLWFWSKFTLLWAIVAALAQVISAAMYYLPYAKQVSSVNLLLPEFDLILNRIDHDWDIVEDMDTVEVNDLILKYKNELTFLEHKYIGDTPLPAIKKIIKLAEKDRDSFVYERFGITQPNYLEEAMYNGK